MGLSSWKTDTSEGVIDGEDVTGLLSDCMVGELVCPICVSVILRVFVLVGLFSFLRITVVSILVGNCEWFWLGGLFLIHCIPETKRIMIVIKSNPSVASDLGFLLFGESRRSFKGSFFPSGKEKTGHSSYLPDKQQFAW